MERNLYFDMDGTLCEWCSSVKSIEELYEKGFYLNLKPNINLLEALNMLYEKYPTRIFILSCYLENSKYAIDEKNIWLDKYTSIPMERRILIPDGNNKGKIGNINDILIDDYTKNLLCWEKEGKKGIKFINDINGSGIKWKGERIKYTTNPKIISNFLEKYIV